MTNPEKLTGANAKLVASLLVKLPIWLILVRPSGLLRFPLIVIAYLVSQAAGWKRGIDHFTRKLVALYGQKLGQSTVAFRIPSVGRIVFPSEGSWIVPEIFIFGVYERFFKPSRNSTLVDIGAHAGSFTVKMAKKVNKVIAIEPNPRAFRYLIQNIKLNELRNVTPIKVALSDRKGVAKLFLGNAAHRSTLIYTRARGDESIEVCTETLDDLVEKLGLDHIDFIKIDVEGAEPKILKGSRNTLASNRPNIAMELHSQTEAEDVSSILNPMGFKTWSWRNILYASHESSNLDMRARIQKEAQT